jgi:exportin-1
MEAAAAHLLNFSQPFDCSLLDQIVMIAMDGSHPQRGAANEFLVGMKDHPDMWRRALDILETSKQVQAKFFGLQVLGEAINTHWKVIPAEQREGIRAYVVEKIIALSSSYEKMKAEHVFLSKLNLVLVQILKQDWPHNWPTFISDLVGASKTSESLCENNMRLLQLLSEEVFDYSKDSLTTAKIRTLKGSLNEEFAQIFNLCEFILGVAQTPSLVLSTLQTLQRFLTWIPLAYIFESNLIVGLITKFMPVAAYRCVFCRCDIVVLLLFCCCCVVVFYGWLCFFVLRLQPTLSSCSLPTNPLTLTSPNPLLHYYPYPNPFLGPPPSTA